MERNQLNRVKKIIIAMSLVLPILFQSAKADAQESEVVKSVRNQLRNLNNTGAFCYVVEGGQVQGVNADQPVRIASVMKLMTTFWALETLGGPNARLKTTVYYRPASGELHIEGSRDPFLNRDRFFLLISDLNRLGIKSVTRLTADENFRMGLELFNPVFNLSEGHSARSTSIVSAQGLLDAFNTKNWWGSRQGYYSQLRRNNPTLNLVSKLSLDVDKTATYRGNPLNGQAGVVKFEFKSAPLGEYLKKINILSVNPAADELFWSLGGPKGFQKFLERNYQLGDAAEDVNTGSGLPFYNPNRDDTSMTCSAVVRLIRRMDMNLEQKYEMDLADVMMISGIDTERGATFNDGSGSLIVKTGTLTAPGAVAKNLAGVMQTTQGEVYFGIFLNGPGSNSGNVRSALSKLASKYRRVRVDRRKFTWQQLDSNMQLQKVVEMNRN